MVTGKMPERYVTINAVWSCRPFGIVQGHTIAWPRNDIVFLCGLVITCAVFPSSKSACKLEVGMVTDDWENHPQIRFVLIKKSNSNWYHRRRRCRCIYTLYLLLTNINYRITRIHVCQGSFKYHICILCSVKFKLRWNFIEYILLI